MTFLGPFGAAAAGARAMTSSSSPGISLKQEGISYMAAAKIPCVIVNVQRGGPGLGGIGPSQSDYFQSVKGGGHGDYHTIVLGPANVQEMHDFTIDAFRLAAKYRNPTLILADGRLGQMMEPIQLYTGKPPPRLTDDWALTGAKDRSKRVIRSLFLNEDDLETHNIKLQKSYDEIRNAEVRHEEFMTDDCDILIAAWGTCARIAKGVVKTARQEGIKAGLFRPITLWPFPYDAMSRLTDKAANWLVIEMNAGQMVEDARLAANGKSKVAFKGFLGSRVPKESEILEELRRVYHD